MAEIILTQVSGNDRQAWYINGILVDCGASMDIDALIDALGQRLEAYGIRLGFEQKPIEDVLAVPGDIFPRLMPGI